MLNIRIKVIQGDQIGGCITEISSGDTRIIFDYGNNLDDTPQISISGLTYGKPKYCAVFISHYHLDHIGSINNILPDIPVYIEETTKKMYDVICDFSNKPKVNAITFKFGDIIDNSKWQLKVKSYRVDHSAYNSSMFLVTDDKEKALYTGDYRDNGYTGDKLMDTLNEIGTVDYLITEGTNIGNNSHIIRKEESLADDFAEIFKQYKQVFVMMSSSNIDRITTLLKACNKTKHIMIQDLYMAHLTSLINKEDKKNIPNPVTYNNVMIYKPKYFKNKNEEFKDKYYNAFNNKNNCNMLYKPFVMNIRTSMIEDLETFAFKKNILTNACLVYSMWGGYRKREDIKAFIKKTETLGIKTIEKDIHTSGHASVELIEKVKKITNPMHCYAIHTEKEGEMDILDLYKKNKTIQRNYFNGKNLKEVLVDIEKAILPLNYAFRTELRISTRKKN